MFDCYDYESAVYDDVKNAIEENFGNLAGFMEAKAAEINGYIYRGEDARPEEEQKKDIAASIMSDYLWTFDNVTGNGSGSYWFSRARASEALSCNFDLLADVGDEYGDLQNIVRRGPEACDVAIRCYLLPAARSRYVHNESDDEESEVEA